MHDTARTRQGGQVFVTIRLGPSNHKAKNRKAGLLGMSLCMLCVGVCLSDTTNLFRHDQLVFPNVSVNACVSNVLFCLAHVHAEFFLFLALFLESSFLQCWLDLLTSLIQCVCGSLVLLRCVFCVLKFYRCVCTEQILI